LDCKASRAGDTSYASSSWDSPLFTQEAVLNPENPSAKVDAELILASRQQEQSNSNNAAIAAAGRGFQSLAMDSALSSLSGASSGFGGTGGGGQGNSDLSSLP